MEDFIPFYIEYTARGGKTVKVNTVSLDSVLEIAARLRTGCNDSGDVERLAEAAERLLDITDAKKLVLTK